jgi:methionyl-tRNA formyltransferase
MGTPEFAVPCLRELIRTEEVAAVFTKADKPSGRGKKLTPSPVKVFAEENGITVFTPLSLKKGDDAETAFETLKQIAPDLIIVTAYGQILPERILTLPTTMPRCINLHGSILPKYRGSAPIERAVMNGETETGITSMVMAAGVDTGDMLLCEKTVIDENETAAALRVRLSEIAADTMLKTLAALRSDTLTQTPQDDTNATFAPMIGKDESRIDFSKSANALHNTIRAITGYSFLEGKRVKLIGTRKTEKTAPGGITPGQIISDGGLYVQCGDGLLQITELLPEGGKRAVSAEEFLRGHKIQPGARFTHE